MREVEKGLRGGDVRGKKGWPGRRGWIDRAGGWIDGKIVRAKWV